MTFLETIVTQITVGKVLTYGFLFALIVFFMLVWKFSKDPNSKFNWIDLISNPDGSASLTRTLQLIAGLTGTWVIIQSTVGKWLTVEIFTVYLAAMGISEGFTKWIQSKKNNE